MRLKKYASSKVVAIILTAMVVLGGLFFQNRQIQNLKKQLSDSQVKIEQMYDTPQEGIWGTVWNSNKLLGVSTLSAPKMNINEFKKYLAENNLVIYFKIR